MSSKILLNGLVVVMSYYVYKSYSALNIIDLTELDKCPFCYGKAACMNLFNGNIKLNSSTSDIFYNLVNFAINSKNVYYGSYKQRSRYKDIVVKKLAHNDELQSFDSFIQTNVGVNSNFQKMENDFRAEINKFSTTKANDAVIKLKLCPDSLALNFLLIKKQSMTYEDYLHIYTMLYVNPEPILMQVSIFWYLHECYRS